MLIKFNNILDVPDDKMEVNIKLIQSCAPTRWKSTKKDETSLSYDE